MTAEDPPFAAALRGLREQAATLRQRNAYPAVERCLHLVDLNLHLALWQPGEMHEPMAELDPEGPAAD